jgi:organic radical activating enzyme
MLRINEIFYSIQGEGFHSGQPAIFIRFCGCNRQCSFCDTKHQDVNFEFTPEQLRRYVAENFSCPSIILTGGEPFLQAPQIIEFLALIPKEMSVAVETNGDMLNVKLLKCWITVSPKGGAMPPMVQFADEIKVVWTGKEDLSLYETLNCPNLYLQPCDGMNNVEDTVKQVLERNGKWKLSLQTQKMINIK